MTDKQVLQTALDYVVGRIKKEILEQGHVATGRLLKSVRSEIKVKNDKLVGLVWVLDYAFILDKGVSASRVPYSQGSGAGSSLYITKLIDWIATIKPGLNAVQRKSFAFAIAQTAKREGHPTKGSYSFSSNGRRTGWAKASITDNINTIRQLLDLSAPVAGMIRDMVNRINKLA